MAKKVRIVSKVEGFRRGGMAHSSKATLHDRDAFTEEQLKAIQTEPNLIVDFVYVDDDDGSDDTKPKTPAKNTPTKK